MLLFYKILPEIYNYVTNNIDIGINEQAYIDYLNKAIEESLSLLASILRGKHTAIDIARKLNQDPLFIDSLKINNNLVNFIYLSSAKSAAKFMLSSNFIALLLNLLAINAVLNFYITKLVTEIDLKQTTFLKNDLEHIRYSIVNYKMQFKLFESSVLLEKQFIRVMHNLVGLEKNIAKWRDKIINENMFDCQQKQFCLNKFKALIDQNLQKIYTGTASILHEHDELIFRELVLVAHNIKKSAEKLILDYKLEIINARNMLMLPQSPAQYLALSGFNNNLECGCGNITTLFLNLFIKKQKIQRNSEPSTPTSSTSNSSTHSSFIRNDSISDELSSDSSSSNSYRVKRNFFGNF